MAKEDKYVVALTDAQWDLVVLALGYVSERAAPPSRSDSILTIDHFCRRVLRRRINEVMAEIQSTVPDAGSGELDP